MQPLGDQLKPALQLAAQIETNLDPPSPVARPFC
jgi:hypothetical protein